MVNKHLMSNMLWEVVEIRRQTERTVAKFVYHEDAVAYHRQKVKQFSGRVELDFDVRQAKRESKQR